MPPRRPRPSLPAEVPSETLHADISSWVSRGLYEENQELHHAVDQLHQELVERRQEFMEAKRKNLMLEAKVTEERDKGQAAIKRLEEQNNRAMKSLRAMKQELEDERERTLAQTELVSMLTSEFEKEMEEWKAHLHEKTRNELKKMAAILTRNLQEAVGDASNNILEIQSERSMLPRGHVPVEETMVDQSPTTDRTLNGGPREPDLTIASSTVPASLTWEPETPIRLKHSRRVGSPANRFADGKSMQQPAGESHMVNQRAAMNAVAGLTEPLSQNKRRKSDHVSDPPFDHTLVDSTSSSINFRSSRGKPSANPQGLVTRTGRATSTTPTPISSSARLQTQSRRRLAYMQNKSGRVPSPQKEQDTAKGIDAQGQIERRGSSSQLAQALSGNQLSRSSTASHKNTHANSEDLGGQPDLSSSRRMVTTTERVAENGPFQSHRYPAPTSISAEHDTSTAPEPVTKKRRSHHSSRVDNRMSNDRTLESPNGFADPVGPEDVKPSVEELDRGDAEAERGNTSLAGENAMQVTERLRVKSEDEKRPLKGTYMMGENAIQSASR